MYMYKICYQLWNMAYNVKNTVYVISVVGEYVESSFL